MPVRPILRLLNHDYWFTFIVDGERTANRGSEPCNQSSSNSTIWIWREWMSSSTKSCQWRSREEGAALAAREPPRAYSSRYYMVWLRRGKVIAFIFQRKVKYKGRKEGMRTVFDCSVDTADRTLTLNLNQGVTRLLFSLQPPPLLASLWGLASMLWNTGSNGKIRERFLIRRRTLSKDQ